MGTDVLETREGIDDYVASHLKKCAEIFADEGVLHAFAVLITRKVPEGATPFREPTGPLRELSLVYFFLSGDPGAAHENLRKEIKALDAVGVFLSTEAWIAVESSPFGLGTPPSERMDRQEALIVSCEHIAYANPRAWIARISRAAGKATLSAFVEADSGGQSFGRLANLMGRAGGN